MNEKLESTVMSSENDFQESQIPDTSSIRMKVDALNLRGKENSQEHVLPNSKCNLRTSLAWDSAFFTCPGILEPDELFPALNVRNFDNEINKQGSEGYLKSSSRPQEPDTNSRDGNFNSRKSLAWDDRFFTSEGVLDPCELAMVNNGFKKSGSRLVPVIEDEVWKSLESNSTLDSEGFSLTRLEMDLFEDMRASMPKPRTSGFSFQKRTSGFELGTSTVPEKHEGYRTKMKVVPTCRRQSINKHASKKITRELPDAPKIQLKHTRELCPPSLKPPKALERANSISRGSTKRASLSEKHFKLVSSSESLSKSKKPCLRDSCNAIHSSTQSLKSSSSHCPISTNKSVYHTKSSIYRDSSSDIIIGKSPNLRRNVKSQGLKLPGPASVTPLAKTRAYKMEVENPHPQSTPTSSSFESPTSTIDEWSSASSSTSAAQRFIRCKPSHQPQKQDQMGSGIKPSNLRMPSPKLGFFDAEKMLVLATKGESLEEVAAGNSGSRTRCSKLRSPGSLRGSGSNRLGRRKIGGTPLSVLATRQISDVSDCLYDENLRSPVRDNTTLTKKSNSRLYPELDFQILHGGNKENVSSFVDQIESLTKHVHSIDLNNDMDNESEQIN